MKELADFKSKNKAGALIAYSNTYFSYGYNFSKNKLKSVLDSKLKKTDFKWIVLINKHEGKVLPPPNVISKLMVKGLVELKLTEEGLEKIPEAKGFLIADTIKKKF